MQTDFQEFSRSFYILQGYFPGGKLHSRRFQEFTGGVATLNISTFDRCKKPLEVKGQKIRLEMIGGSQE